jgi:beta-N-acetylhexosaminidase
MEGILKQCGSVEEAAICSLFAGCDMLLIGGLGGKQMNRELSPKDVKRVHQSLVEAVRSGRISEERLDQAGMKVLELKMR